jgi:hypothetical protein
MWVLNSGACASAMIYLFMQVLGGELLDAAFFCKSAGIGITLIARDPEAPAHYY